MKRVLPVAALAVCFTLLAVSQAWSQNWPQWRGPNRDGKVAGFTAPAAWPKELSQKWKVAVGDGVATPALVDGKLYVFARKNDKEGMQVLDAGTGQEIWKDGYDAETPRGGASGFPGPRASPTVAEGKVVGLGVHGMLTCYDAATGAKLWQKDGFTGGLPQFAPSSSPLVIDGLCIAQVGGEREGGIVAYDLNSGEEKWKWTGDGTSYASPSLVTVAGKKVVVAATAKKLVALNAADGKQLWQTAYTQGRYNSTTPIIDGQSVIYAGPTKGMTAVSIKQQGEELGTEENWKNGDNSLVFNTPVLRDGWLYGISNLNAIFCVNATTGESAWSAPIVDPATAPAAEADTKKAAEAKAEEKGPGDAKADEGKGPGGGKGDFGKGGFGGKGGGGRRGGGGGGYGSVVDAGSVLVAINPTGRLIFFEPNAKEFKQLANYKVAESGTYAYPVIAGNRIYIKDKDSLTLWTLD